MEPRVAIGRTHDSGSGRPGWRGPSWARRHQAGFGRADAPGRRGLDCGYSSRCLQEEQTLLGIRSEGGFAGLSDADTHFVDVRFGDPQCHLVRQLEPRQDRWPPSRWRRIAGVRLGRRERGFLLAGWRMDGFGYRRFGSTRADRGLAVPRK